MKKILSNLVEYSSNIIGIVMIILLLIESPIIVGSIIVIIGAFVFYFNYAVKKRDKCCGEQLKKQGLSEQEINMIMTGPEFMT